ncbi:MAG: class I SAM-dependent methyltransferase [Candidatus Thermoplasmatota archaeon]|nr:class I SAM-dependent methyltransferase [Candidatus Thermoplasmatota archaeon]MBS3790224.1 class I SAM-dependent methyltransferase [Candidatus Thermoplasmatota archaeon]
MVSEKSRIYFDGKHYDAWTEREIDIPFYKKQVKKYGEPVLELGCGTGRITIPIARDGHKIIGLDLSEKLLKRAKEKSKKDDLNIDWIIGDMRDFSLDKRFNLIFIPFNTIHHILTLEDMEKVLENVKEHLEPNGRFMVELFNPDLDILNRDPKEEHEVLEYKNPDGDEEIKVTETTDYEKAKQLMHLTWFYELDDEMVEREWTIRVWFPKEVNAILKYNGFKIEKKYGDFDESTFTNNSGQQIIVCEKRQR